MKIHNVISQFQFTFTIIPFIVVRKMNINSIQVTLKKKFSHYFATGFWQVERREDPSRQTPLRLNKKRVKYWVWYSLPSSFAGRRFSF